MSESNSHWGEVAAHDDEMAAVWDRFERLPEPGQHDLLDVLCEQKHITIGALVKVGARMADTNVLAFAGPGYMKYRGLLDGRKWGYIGSEYPQFKLVPAGAPSDTIIVVEGETDAARLTLAYPGVDIAMLPNGVDCITTAYGAQLERYERVVIATDADEGGERGAANVRALRPDAVRLVPPAKDWCAIEGDVFPELPRSVDDGTQRIGGILFETLDLETSDPDPNILVDDLLYGAGVHIISGHPGGGKTTVAMHLAIDVMAGGGHVAWLDYETNRRQAKRRLEDCGCSATLAAERFHYARFPLEAETHLAELAAHWPHVLVVVDSMSKALSAAGIDENSATEVTSWTTKVVQAVKAHDLPFIIIDHSAKSTKDTRYSRGSGSKLADADVHLRVETNAPFNRERVGALTLHLEKDRDGFLPFETWWEIGDGKGKLPLLRLDSPPAEGDADAEPGKQSPGI